MAGCVTVPVKVGVGVKLEGKMSAYDLRMNCEEN